MTMKLSPVQVRVMEELDTLRWKTARCVYCSLPTLRALKRRGLVESCIASFGAITRPRPEVFWRKLLDKKCTVCGRVLTLKHFRRDLRRGDDDGRVGVCKDCRKAKREGKP